MEKVHLLLMLIDPEIILTTSVHISLPGSSHTASSDETRDGKYCPVIIQHYAKRSLILVASRLANVCQCTWQGKNSLGLIWERALLQTCAEQGQG